MTDRDLMIAVAKAIGGTLSEGHTQRRSLSTAGGWEWIGAPGVVTPDGWAPYPGVVIHPLQDNGDALSLAVALDMSVEISEYEASTYAYAGPMSQPTRVHGYEMWRDDKAAATRRAIVKAAAAVAALPVLSQGTTI